MVRQINLVHHRIRKTPEIARLHRLIFWRLVPATCAIIFFVLILLLGSWYINSRITVLESEQGALRTRFTALAPIERAVRALKLRTNEIGRIINNPLSVSVGIKDIIGALETPGVSFESIQLNKDNLAKVRVVAPDSGVTEAFSTRVANFEKTGRIAEVILSTLTLQKGTNGFQLEVTFSMKQ